MANVNARPGRILWDWRQYFSKANLELGQRDYDADKLVRFSEGEDGLSARGDTVNGFHVEVKRIPATFTELQRYPRWDSFTSGNWTREHFSDYYLCDCSQGRSGARCRHLANLLLRWEVQHGPFVIEQTEAERREYEERARTEREKRIKTNVVRDLSEYFDPLPVPRKRLTFHPDAIADGCGIKANQYEYEYSLRLLAGVSPDDIEMGIRFAHDGAQQLCARHTFDGVAVAMVLSRTGFVKMECACGGSSLRSNNWFYGTRAQDRMCGHALALWALLRQRIQRDDPGDETDAGGERLLQMMTDRAILEAAEAAQPRAEKRRRLTLTPRIASDHWDRLLLTFDLSVDGGRGYAVKGLERFYNDLENDAAHKLTPKVTVNFARDALDEASEPWYRLIGERVRAIQRVNRQIERSGGYANYRVSVGAGIPLEDGELDDVYDLAEGGGILYQYGGRNDTRALRVGRAVPRATMTLEPVEAGGRLTAVRISGSMPRLAEGRRGQYVLDAEHFGRVDDGVMDALAPLRELADRSGEYRCTVGVRKFAEFYHRVLPRLQQNRVLALDDRVSGRLEAVVPPAPEFTFYVDLTDVITCRAEARYDEIACDVGAPCADLPDSRRDYDQERRVIRAVREWFPHRDGERHLYWTEHDDDTLMELLTGGVAALSAYGEVKGSDAFRRVRVRPVPQPSVSLRVEGGLLDLAIKTRDCAPEELLALLDSYRLKRRWHRLKNGDFIDLGDARALDELTEAVEALDVPLEDLIRHGAKVPKYRALYVDRLLESHDDLAAARDKQFKALVRAFQTIRDSDFEVSEGLSEVLRPYQLYGFRWLSTLAQSGFGGILADEMGLGKTLQLLSFIQTRREAGEARPSLVVCPASLVYNWKEECRRFTPGLTVETVDGGLAQRRRLLDEMKSERHADLYVTSYDTLKRDITSYDGLTFATVALDEAQYVKNQRTAVSKAVRVLSAEHRFALTGTPIENRLSELWSIFDFLMPGLLYSAKEFASRFEGPIMKQRDAAATARLARMTEPFILRRKKEDVLKDLPEKLEETRASAMEAEQRRVYDAEVVRMRELVAASGDSSADKLRILAEITRLRQLCCDPTLVFENYEGPSAKRAACLELIQNAMDAGHRMLVFSQFTSMLKLLADDLAAANIPFYTITGQTPKQERLKLVNEFNAGDAPVFLISLKAGGTGLNLTGADVVIHYDPWWNLAVQNQATDRAHRIGQTRQVTVIRLIAADTIEEKIVQLQESKRELAENIITGEGGSLMALSREELMELIG